jgi:hypothetical protein
MSIAIRILKKPQTRKFGATSADQKLRTESAMSTWWRRLKRIKKMDPAFRPNPNQTKVFYNVHLNQTKKVERISPPSMWLAIFSKSIWNKPKKLSQSDVTLAPENGTPPESDQSKLLTTLSDKEEYVLHYRNLKQCLNLGMTLKKKNRGKRFDQSTWLKNIST